jgi:hypothetical protein
MTLVMTGQSSTFAKRAQEIARDYALRGYRVRVSPGAEELPEFLRHFKPDVVAEGPNDSVVVEFKRAKGSRTPRYWAELAQAVQQHPGWRYELVVDNDLVRPAPEGMSPSEILREFDVARQLSEKEPRGRDYSSVGRQARLR